MPRVRANEITIYYDQQGTGEPRILIPYLRVDEFNQRTLAFLQRHTG